MQNQHIVSVSGVQVEGVPMAQAVQAVATVQAVPVQGIPTAQAMPMQAVPMQGMPTVQGVPMHRQFSFAAARTRMAEQPLWRKRLCRVITVIAVSLVTFMLIRNYAMGCGCPAGYSHGSGEFSTCDCSGNIFSCTWDCDDGNCFAEGEPTTCADGSTGSRLNSSSGQPSSSNGTCGCEATSTRFCNYDFGNSGFCEACSNVQGGSSGCADMGLPTAGAADCRRWCFGTS